MGGNKMENGTEGERKRCVYFHPLMRERDYVFPSVDESERERDK